jgi:hypothetical protein
MKPLTISDPIALRGSRERHKRRCCEIALTNTPPNVRVVRVRKSLTGRAHLKAGILAGPKPFTRNALYIFALHGSGRKPRHVEELEAEQWAHARMREAGMSVPRAMTRRAKAYVRRKIRSAIRHGAKRIDPAARKQKSKE